MDRPDGLSAGAVLPRTMGAAMAKVASRRYPTSADTNKREVLPPVSPYWWPFKRAIEHARTAMGGRRELADPDFVAEVVCGNIRSKLEQFSPGIEPERCSELLTPEFYARNYKFDHRTLPMLRPRAREYVLAGQWDVFYWGPDVEKRWPSVTPEPNERPVDPIGPPLRRRGPLNTHDWHTIDGEIALRCIDPKTGRVCVPKKGSALVADMRKWCEEQGWSVPGRGPMSEAVRRVCAVMRRAEK
jgi:hypothetical protein